MRVNFKSTHLGRKDKKKKRINEVITQQQVMKDEPMEKEPKSKMEALGLSKAKRQQIFKKSKKRDVQAQIAELKAQSKKLKKKDVS